MEKQVKNMDVKVKKGKIDFKSFGFLREVATIRKENLKIDRSSKIDIEKMQRRFEV